MKKTFLIGKSFLTYVIAFSILAVSLFTGAVFTADAETIGTCGRTVIEKWDKVSDGVNGDWYDDTYEGGDGTKENPYIISSAEELASLSKNATVENSAEVYYKVDPSIKAFDMNTVSGVDLTVDGLTANEVYEKINGKILGKVWHPGYNGCFAGNFDGSGVTIYGLYSGPAYYNQNSYDTNSPYGCVNGGLFSKIDTSSATLKNFTIKNSYFTGDVSGAVFGDSTITGGSALIENIVVANCYIKSTGGALGGVIGGYLRFDASTSTADKVKINNCLVYDNVVENKAGTAVRLVGTMEAYCDNGSGSKVRDYGGFSISNTIAIGCDIENTGSWWQKDPKFYANCYTTGTPATENITITKIANAEAAKGVAASTNIIGLDKSVWFYNTTTYPALSVMHDVQVTDNGDGTHSEICDCGLTSGNVDHTFDSGICACGAVAKCGEIVSVYSGIPDTSLEGSGTVDSPYLITSADEFAAVALGKIASTENTYFRVDGIDAFYMNGGKEVAGFTSATQVKSYFSSASSNNWVSTGPFIGQFDGNGVTVYGVYAKHTGQYDYAGLFSRVSGHSSIKNIAIKNSYFSSYNKDGSIAALVGGTLYAGDSNTNTSITVENVIVANNYIASTNDTVKSGASVLMGCFFEKHYTKVDNCLIFGNVVENAYTGAGLKSAMITTYNGAGANTRFNNIVSIGVTPWSVVDNKDGTYGSANWYISNVDSGHFKNIYTDQSLVPLQSYNPINNSDTFLEKYNINSLATFDMQGAAAVNNLTTLDANWIFNANGYPELRVFHDNELEVDYATDNYAGHIELCSCGFTTPILAHDYGENHKCIDCGFTCDHANADISTSGGDCLTAATKTVVCSCGYENVSANGTAAGHTFTYKNEVPSADCQTNGVAEHKHCLVCKKDFATDAAANEPMENALTADELKLPVANHTPTIDNGEIIYAMNENEHAKVCSVCREEFENESHQGNFIPNGANGHLGQCEVCLLKTSSETGHNFSGDSKCDDCEWICENHAFVDGNIINEGNCTTDKVVATKCSICNIPGENNITTAPGHTYADAVEENREESTCAKEGSYDEVVYCSVENCKAEISRIKKDLKLADHTPADAVEENRVEATCDENGSYDEVVYCSVEDCKAEISRIEKPIDALGHTLVAVEKVDATTESEGTKAHYACECGKLYSDEEGENEITAESLIIEKLVADDNSDENVSVKPEGDTSDESPNTDDSIVSVAFAAMLVGVAFIATKKFKNR